MLTLELEEFLIELDDGSVKNAGAPNKQATAKLYEVTDAEARSFGDSRVKLTFEDETGNELQAAVDPATAQRLAADLAAAADDLE